MGKFDAATAVDLLEYDFSKYEAGAGEIPEPTTGQMESYFNEIRDIAKSARAMQEAARKMQKRDQDGDDSVSDEEAQEIIAAMDEFSLQQFQADMAAAVARLCSDSPSTDQMLKLPHRVLQAFIKWISGEFRPEGGNSGTKR